MTVPVGIREARDDHVGVPDSLHLVDVVVLDDGVKQSVEIIQHLEYLSGLAGRGEVGEADDVAEVDGDG